MPSPERKYNHLIVPGYGIILPDHKSALAAYGLDNPEYLEQDDKKFLREGMAWFGSMAIRVFQLTKPNPNGFIVVEAEDFGGYHEGQVSVGRVEWKR